MQHYSVSELEIIVLILTRAVLNLFAEGEKLHALNINVGSDFVRKNYIAIIKNESVKIYTLC